MDWPNFLMKHGIGSPGSMAKAQAKIYRTLRQRHPAASEEEILKTMFVQRAWIGIATGCRDAYEMIDAPGWVDAVVRSNPDLLCLAVYIILCEYPELRRADTPPDAFPKVVRVIADALDEVAPDWRQHFSGVLDPDTGEHRPPPSAPKTTSDSAGDSDSGLGVSCPKCGLPNDDLHPERVNHHLFVGRYECENCLATIDYRVTIHDPFSPGGVELVAEEVHQDEECGAAVPEKAVPAIRTEPSIYTLHELEPIFVGHTGTVNKVRFSQDGKYVLSCGADRTIRLWDTNSRSQLRFLETAKPVESVTFVPGAWHMASADGQMIRLWDANSGGEENRFVSTARCSWLCVSPRMAVSRFWAVMTWS